MLISPIRAQLWDLDVFFFFPPVTLNSLDLNLLTIAWRWRVPFRVVVMITWARAQGQLRLGTLSVHSASCLSTAKFRPSWATQMIEGWASGHLSIDTWCLCHVHIVSRLQTDLGWGWGIVCRRKQVERALWNLLSLRLCPGGRSHNLRERRTSVSWCWMDPDHKVSKGQALRLFRLSFPYHTIRHEFSIVISVSLKSTWLLFLCKLI